MTGKFFCLSVTLSLLLYVGELSDSHVLIIAVVHLEHIIQSEVYCSLIPVNESAVHFRHRAITLNFDEK